MTKTPNSPYTISLTLWMKTLVFVDLSPSTTMKLSYLPVSPIWTSRMIREQSPEPRLSSGTSTRPSNSFACHFSDPRCSSTVSARVIHWMWQAEEASCPWGGFHLQGRTASSPTLDEMDGSLVMWDREEESGRREALRMEIERNVLEIFQAPLKQQICCCNWSSMTSSLESLKGYPVNPQVWWPYWGAFRWFLQITGR